MSAFADIIASPGNVNCRGVFFFGLSFWGSGILRERLGPNVPEGQSASLRKYGKRSFPYLRILAAWVGGRRSKLPLTDLGLPSDVLRQPFLCERRP